MQRPNDAPTLTAERRAAIVRLLETLDDGLPVAVAAPLSTLGFVHRAPFRESCPDCLANGRTMFGCVTCGGRGYLEGRRSKDPYDTGAAKGWFGSSAAKHARDHERDREIGRLEEQTAPPKSEKDQLAETPPDVWEVERDRMRGRFHYAELAAALEELRMVDDSASRALHAVWVYGWLAQTTPRLEALLDRGLVFVSDRLPAKLRAPDPVEVEQVKALGVKERNAVMRKAFREEGATSQWLAREYGLSVSQVNRVLAGEEDPS